jgi:hypothetical protein
VKAEVAGVLQMLVPGTGRKLVGPVVGLVKVELGMAALEMAAEEQVARGEGC